MLRCLYWYRALVGAINTFQEWRNKHVLGVVTPLVCPVWLYNPLHSPTGQPQCGPYSTMSLVRTVLCDLVRQDRQQAGTITAFQHYPKISHYMFNSDMRISAHKVVSTLTLWICWDFFTWYWALQACYEHFIPTTDLRVLCFTALRSTRRSG